MREFHYDEKQPPAYRPWHQSGRMNHMQEWARARSADRFEAQRETQEARSAGLVSESTSCRVPEGVSVVDWMGENTIEIDKHLARVTRLRKGLGIAAKQLHNQGTKTQKIWMLTLTYAGTNRDWRAHHISNFLADLRTWHYSRTGTRKVRYAWVAELQKRGVIHYHVIVWLENGLTPPKPDSAWKKHGVFQRPMWCHGMSNRLKATAPVAYLMKYASKIEQKNVGSFPRGARIHGSGGLDESGRCIRRWVLWPSYVQGNAAVGERFKPAKGGGYCNRDTGELLLSEWAPTGGGFSRFVRVRHTPRRIDPVGPFSWLKHDGIEPDGPFSFLKNQPQ